MEYKNEIWKVLNGINENFAISNYGRKKNLTNGYISKPMVKRFMRNKKYSKLCYHYYDINNKHYFAHRLVAMFFIENNDKTKNHVNHIDGDPFNNYVSNLEWCDSRENTRYRFRKGIENIKSKYIGVRPYNTKTKTMYGAQISINGRTIGLGTYYTEIEAYEAYKQKCIEINRKIIE